MSVECYVRIFRYRYTTKKVKNAAAENARLNPGVVPTNDANGPAMQGNIIEPDDDISTVYGMEEQEIIEIRDNIPGDNGQDAIIVEDDEEDDAESQASGAASEDQGAALKDQRIPSMCHKRGGPTGLGKPVTSTVNE